MKKYTLTVIDDGNTIHFDDNNEGFNTLEIMGIMELKTRDIYQQIQAPAKFTGTATDEAGNVLVREEA